jgi:hypothetical protein
MAEFDESSDAGKYAYRTPFYQKLKQLNTDICTFMIQSKSIKPKSVYSLRRINVEKEMKLLEL